MLTTTILAAAFGVPMAVHAAPRNGLTTSGSATIQQSGSTTSIIQSTDRAIVRWDGFDVNAGEQVRFQQPSASSITVNRIRDVKASQINGRISANGNVVLINPNGMVFGAGAQVNVGGIVATTSDLEDDHAFMFGGAMKFTRPGNPDASIVNHGSISVRDAGLAGLVAPHVENHGVIQARLGKVQLASGDVSTIDMAGDGLIKLEVSDPNLKRSISNTGTLQADGGAILLTAAQARDNLNALITTSGRLQANSVDTRKGSITLSTRGLDPKPGLKANGIVHVSGTVQAIGMQPGEQGGAITLLGDNVTLDQGALIDASGQTGGGRIRIGGDYQGGPALYTADHVLVDASVVLKANALQSGDGGSIVLWSDKRTSFYGHAEARSGMDGGNGGFIEISGKQALDFEGTADLRAVKGVFGLLLLDPTNITISNAADQSVSGTSPYTPDADNATSILNVATLQNALGFGNVIVQTRATGAQAGDITVNAPINWNSGTLLTLNAHNNIVVNQAISGGSVTMIAGGDVQLNNTLTGTGTLTLQPLLDTATIGIGPSAVGIFNLGTTEIAQIASGWAGVVIGRPTSSAAMDVRAATWNAPLTLQSGTGIISISGTQTMGANNLSIITDGNPNITGNLSGTGTFSLSQASAGTTLGLGTGQTGTILLTTTELGKIINGWSNLVFGRTDGSGAVNVGALSWNDFLTLQSGSGGLNINGVQSMSTNNLTLVTDGDILIGASGGLTGTGTLTIAQATAGSTLGLGDGQTGAVNLTTPEIGRITNGWGNLIFGRTDGSGAVNVGTLTWNDFLTLQSGTGSINVNGAQTMAANNLTIRTDADPNIAAALTGTAAFTLVQSSAGTSLGLGTGTGTVNLSATETGNITNGWASLVFGRTDGTGTVDLGALAWNDILTLQSGSGIISISGTQTMAANNLTIRTDGSPVITAGLTGTGTFLLTPSSIGTSIGLGNGQAGTINLNTATLNNITNGWASLVFGRTDGTGDMNVGAAAWNDVLTLRTASGALNINGIQTMNANNLTLSTNSDLAINAALTGTGTLAITPTTGTTSVGIGTGQAGMLQLSDAELARITNGWAAISIGSTTQTGAMNVGAASWNDPLTLRTSTGVMSINGTQTMAGNNLTIGTDADLAINAALTGTGTLTIAYSTAATSFGIGTGQTGTVQLSDTELGRITDGWTSRVFGSTGGTGAMNVGAFSWVDPVTFRTSTGVMSINGTQTMAANNLTLTTGSNLALNANLIGTGVLSLTGSASTTTMGIGTGQTGTVQLSDTELGRITDGWSSIIIGSTSMTGAMNVGGYTWLDSLDLRTSTGLLNINGTQNMGTNNLTLRTNSNLTLLGSLNGTGSLTILPSSNATTMAVGTGQSGTLALSDAELALISDGWSSITLGSNSVTAAMNVGAWSWQDNVIFRTNTGPLTIAGTQSVGANNLSIYTNVDPVINAALTGTGTLTLAPSTTSVTIGVGTGQVGTFALSDAEIGRFTNGWNSIVIGTAAQTGVMNVGAATWNDNLSLITGTGLMTIAGAQNMNGNNLTLSTDSSLAINAALIGTGKLAIQSSAAATTIGIGTGQTGTLSLLNTELANITNGWNSITIGRTDGTGAMNVAAATWNDDLILRTGTGVMSVNGIQTMGANNLTLSTDSDLLLGADLVGTGTLTIQGSNIATAIGVGTGQAGGLALSSTDLSRLVDGWSRVNIGRTDGLGAVTVGTNTWLNAMSFLAQGNIVLNGVQTSTETSGNSLVLATTNGAFINNAGASALNPGGGRVLVYSVDANNDTLGGMTRPTILTNKNYAGYGPSSVTQTGNVFLYSGLVAKILYLILDDKQKEYGGNLPIFTYSYTGGLQNGDTLSNVVTSYNIGANGSSALDNAGTTRAITGSFVTAFGYTVQITNGTLTVTKAPITIAADDTSREYGDTNPALTASYTGFRNGDDTSDLTTLATVSTAANALSNVGSYAITASGAADNNYSFIYVDGNLGVTKATLTAAAQNATRQYGDANPTISILYSGFKNGDTQSVIDVLGTASSAANALSNVGSYGITAGGALDNNYDFNYTGNTLTVTKAALLATAQNTARQYGDANPALTIAYTGFKNGETQSVIDTLGSASSSANLLSNVGNYAITASSAVDNNYSFTYAGGTLAINKATLTATAQDATRIYGDANPAFTIAYSGFKNGETQSVIDSLGTATSAANALFNVGNYTITASGAVDDNYSFTYANGTLGITKASLTATAQNASREYGDANPTFTLAYTGFKNGDTQSVIDTFGTATSAANTLSNVGNYAITASGAVDNNYSFTYANGTLAVTKANLTATAQNVSREYGDANPALNIAYAGFKNGETQSAIDTLGSATSSANPLSSVGNYAITVSGAADNNYSFTYVGGTLAVTKANLTATAQNATREYGDANPGFAIVYSGFKNGENQSAIDTLGTASTSANALSNVGYYDITAGGALDNNYSFTYINGVLGITKANLIATAQNASREYGDANPVLNVAYSGFKNGESQTALDTLATAATSANALSDAGTYGIAASGASDHNYSFSYVDGVFTVTKAHVVATAQNSSREYGDINPAFGISYTGFKNGENQSALDTLATASTAANAFSSVGNYAIAASGAADHNYDISYVDGSLTVTKAMLQATAQDATRIYGDANPAFGMTYIGFKNNENQSVIDSLGSATSTANTFSGTGNYGIAASGATDDNYSFQYQDGTLSITKALLTATAQNASRTYGDANPALTVGYSGFKNGETQSVLSTLATATSSANAFSNVGNYGISASGAAADNYDFNYTDGTLSVTKALLTATAQNASRVYGDANPALAVSYSGFKNGETQSVLDTLATATTSANAFFNVGNYGIAVTGATAGNYDFAYVGGTLSIAKADLLATAQDMSRAYGEINPNATILYTGFKNGQDATALNSLAVAFTSADANSDAGSYVVRSVNGMADNYNILNMDGTLTIGKAVLDVAASSATRTYGDSNPDFQVSYSGFKNGQNQTALTSFAQASSANSLANTGSYAVTASGAAADNYSFHYIDGTLTITKALLTATADDQTRFLGQANPSLAVSYAGFRNGDTVSVLNVLASAGTVANPASPAGNYSIIASGGFDNNYDFHYINGILTVVDAVAPPAPPAPAPLPVSQPMAIVNPPVDMISTNFLPQAALSAVTLSNIDHALSVDVFTMFEPTANIQRRTGQSSFVILSVPLAQHNSSQAPFLIGISPEVYAAQ